MPSIHTTGTIARDNGVPVHKVVYIIKSRGIRPVGRAGHADLFDESAARWVASELARIAHDREGGIR